MVLDQVFSRISKIYGIPVFEFVAHRVDVWDRWFFSAGKKHVIKEVVVDVFEWYIFDPVADGVVGHVKGGV